MSRLQAIILLAVVMPILILTKGSEIQQVTTAKILDASETNNFSKIETRVYKDPNVSGGIYIICNLMLSTSGEVIFAERSFIPGSGLSGESIQNFPNDTFIDIDVVDSINACRYVALTDSVYWIMPEQQSVSAVNFSVIEATTSGDNDTVVIMCKPDTTIIFPTPPFDWPALSNCKTLDAVYNQFDNVIFTARHDGLLEIPDPAIVGLSNGTAFIAMQGYDGAFPGGGANPSFAMWPNGDWMLCGEGKFLTIVCCNVNSFAEVIRLNSTSQYYYSRPTISALDNALFALSALKTYYNGSASEYTVLVMNQLYSVVTTYTKQNVNLVTQRAMDGYIFVTYFANETLSLDVLQYGTNTPSVTPPVSAPSATPVILTPTATPSELPLPPLNPQGISPSTSPEVAPVGLSQEATISIAVVVSGIVAGLAIFFIVFFVRKNKAKKANSKKKRLEDEDKTKYEAIQLNNPVITLTNTTSSSVSSGTFDTESIDKRLRIPYKRLKFIKEIGSGSYGKVFCGEWRGAKVAIKVNNQITDVDGFLHEAKLTLGIAPHPNLVQTFGVSLDGPNPCIVLEFCGGGSLDKLVFNKNNKLTNQQRKDFAVKIAYGLLHLHNNNIVHRDLAARNILLTTDGEPKITDFGMSRVIHEDAAHGKTKQTVGPMRWMAPESLVDQTYSFKSDVWTYGILVYEIVAGEEPHEDEDQLYIGGIIRDEGLTPDIPNDCNPVLKHVMQICWKKDPNQRPSMEDIIDYLQNN